ncbi:hypothetical protein DRO61_05135 [Candidatus Bathyarchaeota archaeon]|nr:MAG: hypothetical protein DRO61_05135 [Candidatus Bathyarchaeota archaeon]
MNILLLTPINPVLAADVYNKVSRQLKYDSEKVGFLCYPFFAEVACMEENRAYLPRLFSMMLTSLEKEMNKKLYNKNVNIVIGNAYKTQHFDIVIAMANDTAYIDDEGEEVYDSYIQEIKHNKELKDFAELVRINELYGLKEAEMVFPTVRHAVLFLDGVTKPNAKRNTIK